MDNKLFPRGNKRIPEAQTPGNTAAFGKHKGPTAVQDIFRDFVVWLLEFLVISASLLTAARIWDLRRKRRQAAVATAKPAQPPIGRRTV